MMRARRKTSLRMRNFQTAEARPLSAPADRSFQTVRRAPPLRAWYASMPRAILPRQEPRSPRPKRRAVTADSRV